MVKSAPVTNPIADPARLAALAETAPVGSPSSESIDRCVRIARAAVAAPVVLVSLVDDQRQFFLSAAGLPEPWATRRETPLSHSFCKHVVQTGRPLIVTDSRTDERVSDNPAIAELSVLSYAGMPIRSVEGQTLGSFCAIDSQARDWSADDLAILKDLAAIISDELQVLRRAARAEQAEVELIQLNKMLSAKFEDFSRGAASAAHDLRSPLSVLSIGVHTLAKNLLVESTPAVAKVLDMLRRNVDHAVGLAGRVDQTSSLLAATFSGSADVIALSRQVCADLQLTTPSIELQALVPTETEQRVQGTSQDVRRCLENLVGNAMRFAVSRVYVTVSLEVRHVAVAIEDDGPGLDPESYTAVWEEGKRLHMRQGLSGTGLGLSIVKQFVEANGGHVFAGKSTTLGGACFTLCMLRMR